MKVSLFSSYITTGTCGCKGASTQIYRIDSNYKEPSIRK